MAELKARAIEMREAGIGGKRIAKELGIGGALVCDLLRGVPLPGSLQRPRAKDDLREAAVDLRMQGRTYDEIVSELGVSKGSLSLWLRDLPHPTEEQRVAVAGGGEPCEPPVDSEVARQLRAEGWLLREIAVALSVTPKTVCLWTRGIPVPPRAMHGKSAEELRAINRASWDARLAGREVQRQAVKAAAAARIGALSDRELELIAVTAYWCEGAKDKPWDRREFVSFINSDRTLILLFLEYLRRKGFGLDSLRLRLQIHETADVPAAERWWCEQIGINVDRLSRTTLKRHAVRTNHEETKRKNTGDDYVGCLHIGVLGSRVLYQEIEGAWRGISRGWKRDNRSDASSG
ncbi:MAG: hypothetical protein JWM40_1945 [Frankiales bacterium]|nr:hypothetical protein [Frankiales bacterium]